MLAPVPPPTSPAAADFETILALARFEALATLRRLLTDPPESPSAARELRMAASAILRIAPEPCLNEPRAQARGHTPEPFDIPQTPTRAPEPARRMSRRDRRAAAAQRARCPATNTTQNSS